MQQVELASLLGIKQPQLSKWISKGCPSDSKENAEQWIRTNIRQRRRTISQKVPAKRSRLLPKAAATDDVDSWEARLKRVKSTELSLYNALQDAIAKGHTSQLNQLRSNHAIAVKNVAEAEKEAASIQVQTGELIPRSTLSDLLSEVLIPLRSELEALPLRERGRCNPEQPQVAEQALKDAVGVLLLRISTVESRV